MIEIKAPDPVPIWNSLTRIFLAGSIEMGVADNWQTRFIAGLEDHPVTLLNPRRDDWDASWEQSIDNPQFAEQVNWELDKMTNADFVAFYFDPKTKSPITLMELGLMAGLSKSRGWYFKREAVVCCPPGFWRKGNVDIICQRAGIKMVDTLEDLIEFFTKEDE
jgi:hypothetical protein